MNCLVILIPSALPTGPVKGAIALANALSSHINTCIVTIRGPGVSSALLCERVRSFSLRRPLVPALFSYKRFLKRLRGSSSTIFSLSFCFSADLANVFCSNLAITCTSVRGQLSANYRFDYGPIGSLIASIHYSIIRRHDIIFSMSDTMASHLFSTHKIRSIISYNFIDESPLKQFALSVCPMGPLRFIFIGSLSERKQPLLVLRSLLAIHSLGYEVHLDIVGEGPLESSLKTFIHCHQLSNSVCMHGFLPNPFSLLAQADAFVLPSLSEGISRASLESLFLGVPAILRDVDANHELITNGVNGFLFTSDNDLSQYMLKAAHLSRNQPDRPSLLPYQFRQSYAIQTFLKSFL